MNEVSQEIVLRHGTTARNYKLSISVHIELQNIALQHALQICILA